MNGAGPVVLVVDDEPETRKFVGTNLSAKGFRPLLAEDGSEALKLFGERPIDLVLLDLSMPGPDGVEVCRAIRHQSDVPIVILSGHSREIDKVNALDVGADDYLTKPFATEVLLARINAIVRRTQAVPEETTGLYQVGGLFVDLSAGTVTRDAALIDLTDLEFKLLCYLILHRGRTATREQILRDVWQLPSTVETRTIDRHVNALRSIMDGKDEETWPIKSVYGIGYKLVDVERVEA